MRLLGSGSQETLGLQIDGHQIQVAHLRRKGKQIALVGLNSAPLVNRLDTEHSEEGSTPEAVDTGDILGLVEESEVETIEPEFQEGEEEEEEQEPDTNSEVLYRLLERFPIQRCNLAVSLMETGVFFTDFDDTFGLKGRKLKKRLMEETEKERSFKGTIPLAERHAFFQTDQGTLLSIVHEDPLEVLNLLDELKPFVGRVQIGLIEPLEITLMNLVKLSYPPEQHATAIVFAGEDFSRVVFMRNGDYLAFSQPIHEGFQSSQILPTLYARILFEQDVSGLPEIGRVLLAGGCQTIAAQPFFAEQFPDAQVDYLALPQLDLSELDEQDQDLVSNFAVPIGLAWKVLQPKAGGFYSSNFIPKVRQRLQNPFELAWHGLVLIALLVSSLLFLGMRAQDKSRTIDSLVLSIELKDKQIRENNPYAKRVQDLQTQIGDYERNFALIDTLSSRQVSWSSKLREVAGAVEETGGVWLERFATLEGDLDVEGDWGAKSSSIPREIFMYGKTSRRSRVPKFAERVGEGQIPSIGRTQIRGKTIYEFELRSPVLSSEERP